MTEQQPPDSTDVPEERTAEAVTPAGSEPPVRQANYETMTRRQHLREALRGRPIMLTAAAITALVVGLGGFGIGYAVGNHHDRGDRFGRASFEPGQLRQLPGGPGGQYGQAPPGWSG